MGFRGVIAMPAWTKQLLGTISTSLGQAIVASLLSIVAWFWGDVLVPSLEELTVETEARLAAVLGTWSITVTLIIAWRIYSDYRGINRKKFELLNEPAVYRHKKTGDLSCSNCLDGSEKLVPVTVRDRGNLGMQYRCNVCNFRRTVSDNDQPTPEQTFGLYN